MYVKPRTPDVKVMDPLTGTYLPPEGQEVPDNDYWRRLRDIFKDVEECDPPAAATAPEAGAEAAPQAAARDAEAGAGRDADEERDEA